MSGALVAEWSRLLAESLVAAGLEHVVLSPGSRSTPFTWAFGTHPRLTRHVLVDERAAAFFALGLARVSGKPALLLCTSGTAGANYFPAVVEASLAQLPLLVLTADRPLEVQGTNAAQTIDQMKLYGDHARAFFDLGAPEAAASVLAALPRLVSQAYLRSRFPEPGPVHLNARARKPLEPSAPATAPERELAEQVDALLGRGPTRVGVPSMVPDPHAIEDLAARLARAKRGVIVCGPAALYAPDASAALSELSERLGMPIYAEATSQLRFGSRALNEADALDWLLRSAPRRNELGVDLVLRFGAPPTSSGLEQLLAERGRPELHVVAEHGFPDPTNAAESLTFGGTAVVAGALVQALSAHRASAQLDFRASLTRANERVWQCIDRHLASARELTEATAVRTAVAAVPEGGLLVVGNSLPVREVDAFVASSARRIQVASQRGANGIDGLIAGAAGAARASGVPTLLLLGDVSFAHDLGGLAAARCVKSPFVVMILDNDGGRIFEQLPAARLFGEAEEHAELWLSPPGIDFRHAGPLFGMPFSAPTSVSELEIVLRHGLATPGPSLVHARVPPHAARDSYRAIAAELGALAP
jgi:2-succinyl-5-enolpyruvyl-6-hydroxy-3-cyclohexene-1-carboxylate synthase